MAQDSWPNSGHNSRAVTDSEYEALAERFSDDGVYGDPSDTAVVTAGVGLSVTVASGTYASLRGHAWYSGTTDVSLTITANSSGSTRIDRVVLRLDRSDWTVAAVVRAGTAGSGAPALVQDSGDTGVYEIPLALVTVPNGATSVTVTRGELYTGSRIRPCTSTTRNPKPALGEMCFETDTQNIKSWNGSTWVSVYEDSGTLTLSGGFDTWDQHIANVGRRIGPFVWLRIGVKRKGSTLHKDDPDGSKIAVLPSELRISYCNNFFGGRVSNGSSGRVEVRTDGTVWITSLSGDVPIGETVVATVCYMSF